MTKPPSDRITDALRGARERLSRSRLTGRLLGLPELGAGPAEPGLVLIQIDGLSKAVLFEALRGGHAPYLARLLERSLQVDALLGPGWLGHPDFTGPRVLCGDLDAMPFFPVCRRIGRVLRDCQGGGGKPRRATFLSRAPIARIDHVFADPGLRVVTALVPESGLVRVASDHLPLAVDVAIE